MIFSLETEAGFISIDPYANWLDKGRLPEPPTETYNSFDKKMKSSLRIPSILPLVSLFAATSLPGSAALLAYDTFDGYTNGSLNSQNKGVGWGGAWSGNTTFSVTSSGGLTGYGGTASTGTAVANGGFTLSRAFSTSVLSSLPTTGNVYIGFLLQQPLGNNPHGASFLVSGGVNKTAYAGAWNGTTNWEFARQDGAYSNSNTGVTEASSQTVPTFFVMKLELSATSDRYRLFVNPANAAALGGTGNGNYLFSTGFEPTGIGFYHEQRTGAQGNVRFDEIRVGTAPEDMFVTIPEPSAALLAGLGFLALLRRRR